MSEELIGQYAFVLYHIEEGHSGGSLARFTNLKNRGSRFMDIKNSFSRITKIRK